MLSRESVESSRSFVIEARWSGRVVDVVRVGGAGRVVCAGVNVDVFADRVRVAGVDVDVAEASAGSVVDVGDVAVAVRYDAARVVKDDSVVDVGWWRNASMALFATCGILVSASITPTIPPLGLADLERGKSIMSRTVLPPKPDKPKLSPPKPKQHAQKAPSPSTVAKAKPLTPKESRAVAHDQALLAMKELGLSATNATSGVFGQGNEIDVALAQLNGAQAASGGLGGLGTRAGLGGNGGHGIEIGSLSSGALAGTRDGKSALLGKGTKAGVTVDVTRVRTEGALSREEIQRVLSRAMSRFRYCYERELTSSPDLEGKLGTSFVIGGSGDVVSASAVDAFDSDVDACVLRTLRSLKFPSPRGGGVVAVTYPFVFAVK
jgi:hypothetical protein